jgi:hypothetical protein
LVQITKQKLQHKASKSSGAKVKRCLSKANNNLNNNTEKKAKGKNKRRERKEK